MYKFFLFFILSFYTIQSYSQRIKMEYTTVNFYDKFRWNYTLTDIDNKTKQSCLTNLNGKKYADITFKNYGNETMCLVIFPQYKLKYEGYYPENTTLKEILWYWDEYNVVNDSVLDLSRIQDYCKNTGYRLKPTQ